MEFIIIINYDNKYNSFNKNIRSVVMFFLTKFDNLMKKKFQIIDAFKTGLCQKKQKQLLVAIEQAWDQGYLTYDVPFREYNYSLYNIQVNS